MLHRDQDGPLSVSFATRIGIREREALGGKELRARLSHSSPQGRLREELPAAPSVTPGHLSPVVHLVGWPRGRPWPARAAIWLMSFPACANDDGL
jgi:hypothetical protein